MVGWNGRPLAEETDAGPCARDPSPVARGARVSAARLWRTWLGTEGIPGPLDRLLANERVDTATFRALTGAATWGATVAAALGRRDAPVLEQLRRLDPEDVLGGTAICTGGTGPDRIRRSLLSLRKRLDATPGWASACLRNGVPEAWAPHLERRAAVSGEETVRSWLAAQTTRPPLWVRARDADVAGDLRAEGYRVRPHDSALAVEGSRGIESSGVYRQGRMEVQDAASQRCGALVELRPGQIGWDVCAGRGGKTTQIADGLDGRGAVHATDIDPNKLRVLKTRLRRAGLAGVVRVHAWDGLTVPAFGPEARGGFDVALVDAPCSSTGTWRRNPDARLRVDPAAIPKFPELQHRLAVLAAGALGPRGRLVYATCSFTVDEDEAVVDAVSAETGLVVRERMWIGPPALDSDTLFAAVLSR